MFLNPVFARQRFQLERFQLQPPNIESWGLENWQVVANRIIQFFLIFAGVMAVIGIIVGGYWYITSAGNPDQTAKAKSTLFGSIIGLAIILSAWAIISFVINQIFR